MTTPLRPAWIDLDGAENVRDLAGMPVDGGGVVHPGRLIRSDSLCDLSPADVRHLVDDRHVTAVVDLRTDVEVAGDGAGPLADEPGVRVERLSLFPDTAEDVEVPADGPVVLPWTTRDAAATEEEKRRGATGVYLRYLDERPDSILAALRLIATTPGAAVVHCAAGKDRTGTIVALALSEVGVDRDAIIADYATSGDRIEAIMTRLAGRRTYADYTSGSGADGVLDPDRHRPRAETMRQVLAELDERFGGPSAWLRSQGWTDADAAALRTKLLD